MLDEVFEVVGRRLAAIAPSVPVEQGNEPPVAHYFSDEPPVLRLVTGLCEGADALAVKALERVNIPQDPSPELANKPTVQCLETEFAAVIPFEVAAYRLSRPLHFQAEFDRQLTACDWVLALDGIYEKPNPDTPIATKRRARAYRAQSALVLRQCDILIAAANPDEPGKAGGTLETVRDALSFELPVIFLHLGTGEMFLVDPQNDLYSALAEKAPSEKERKALLQKWVNQITIDPDNTIIPPEPQSRTAHKHGENLLREFFEEEHCPALDAHKWSFRLRNSAWSWFENRFKSGDAPKSEPTLPPYLPYRARASALSSHYSGLYRGAFVLNYLLAIVAVILAAASLALLGSAKHTSVGEQVVTFVEKADLDEDKPTEKPPTESVTQPWLLVTLLGFSALKLLIVTFIAKNTREANRNRWNDKAVDYRYLAERLRAMSYLPVAGSCQPPAAAPPQFASRVIRQSRVDWLFDSIIRGVSPAQFPAAKSQVLSFANGQNEITIKRLWTLNPSEAVSDVRDRWITEQAKYHGRTANTMRGIRRFTDGYASLLGRSVIAIVLIDFVIIGGELLNWIPPALSPWANFATPWLVFISAILPAMVAAMNGIRFQSECERLAERSTTMSIMLRGRPQPQPGESQGRWELADRLARRMREAKATPAADPGSWSHDSLKLTELVATDFVQEAAEWSVLYTKEVTGPG